MNNEQLRREMREKRRKLPLSEQKEASEQCCKRILALEAYRNAKTVMCYVAVRGELDISPVMEDALGGGKRLLLPLCEAPGVMTARHVGQLSELESGAFGIMEPKKGCPVCLPEEIDLILVPGVAFDAQGHRIGQGGGYYDRFLPKTRAIRLGVCHAFALKERLDTAPHDAMMHMLVTPGSVISFKEENP